MGAIIGVAVAHQGDAERRDNEEAPTMMPSAVPSIFSINRFEDLLFLPSYS